MMGGYALFYSVVFTKLFDFFAGYFTKKVALSLAAISTFIAALVVVWGLIKALILGIMFTWPPSSGPMWAAFYTVVNQLLPPNFPSIVAAVTAGDAAIFLYRWNHENVFRVPLTVR
jgi:hypothetical protein